MTKVLVIDDDVNIRRSLEIFLQEEGYRSYSSATAREGLNVLRDEDPDIILLDICLPESHGLDILEQILAEHPDKCVIMITALSDLQNTVKAMQQGAFDYIIKPVNIEQLKSTIARALKAQTLSRDLQEVADSHGPAAERPTIVGRSPQIHEIFKTIGAISQSNVTVFIQGESGTGKELIARAIHQSSFNARHPFVPVNCTALPEGLLESELFGHVKGAFTGAVMAKRGKFELAGEGTIFLDEIGDMSPKLQAKLLRVLQERQFEKVGGEAVLPMHARVVAASHRNIEQLIREGLFREDLYYRLKIVSIRVPALRERSEDIPLLVEHFLAKLNERLHCKVRKVEPEAMEKLLSYHWPGNVRQLENVLTRALISCKGDVLMKEHLSFPQQNGDLAVSSSGASLKEVERQHILKVLDETGWQKSLAARRLGISKPTLYKKIKEYNLEQNPSSR